MCDSGTVILKFFLHISEEEQKKRVKKILKDPTQAWQVDREDQRLTRDYPGLARCVEEMLQSASPHFAPWTIVEGLIAHALRQSKVFRTVLHALETAVQDTQAQTRLKSRYVPPEKHPKPTILDHVNLSKSMERAEYSQELPRLQVRARNGFEALSQACSSGHCL